MELNMNTQEAIPIQPWNKGKITGQKKPLHLHEIWKIRTRLELAKNIRELALFDLSLDSKLRGCDLVRLKVSDIAIGRNVLKRSTIIQRKTGKPVTFEITAQTRDALVELIAKDQLKHNDFLFKSRNRMSKHLSTRQYMRIVKRWVGSVGLDPYDYGTHTMRRTKAALIYKRTHNLRAIQLLLGHSKIESTVRYLGVDIDDALLMSEETEI